MFDTCFLPFSPTLAAVLSREGLFSECTGAECYCKGYTLHDRGVSSIGRALPLQGRGCRFESDTLHCFRDQRNNKAHAVGGMGFVLVRHRHVLRCQTTEAVFIVNIKHIINRLSRPAWRCAVMDINHARHLPGKDRPQGVDE